MINLLGDMNKYDCEISLSFVSVSFNSNILRWAALVPHTTFPAASSLLCFLVSCLLFSFVSELLVFTLALPQRNREFTGHLIKPENRSYPLILPPNYLWILRELFLPAKVKFLKLSYHHSGYGDAKF